MSRVPKEIVVLQDHNGYSERARALSFTHPCVVAVSPDTHPHAHTRSFPPPLDWLPCDGELLRRCWWKADAMALAAVQHLNLEAEFYWFIESDVVASQVRWHALFEDHKDNPADCLSLPMGRRNALSKFKHWEHPGTPPTADRHFIMAIYRLSRRAVEHSISRAAELRECFSEVAVPLVIRDAGLSFSLINRNQHHFDGRTMRVRPEEVMINPLLLNHPVKRNSFAP